MTILMKDQTEQEMTFQKMIDNGYQKPDTVDAMTWEMLIDWFGARRVVPDFDRYFKRALNLHFPYYRQLLRVDPTISQFDWFIEQYNEEYEENLRAASNTNTNTSSGSENDTESNSIVQTNSGSEHGTNLSKTSSDNRDITHGRKDPMSASYTQGDIRDYMTYVPTVDGESQGSPIGHGIANPMMTNPSESVDKFNMVNGIDKDTNDSTYTGSISGSGSRNGTKTKTGSQSGHGTENSNSIRAKITSGRHNKISEMINEARSTIMHSESWEWFYHQMDKCFYQCYN